MTTETTIEKAKAVIEEMRELLARLEAERAAPRRKWPEKVEAGDCFAHGDRKYVFFGRLVNMGNGNTWAIADDPFGGDQEDFTYLGKIDLTIRTDAHEPTGAELVGKVCEYSNDGVTWVGRPVCAHYAPERGERCYKALETLRFKGEYGNWFKYARLAR